MRPARDLDPVGDPLANDPKTEPAASTIKRTRPARSLAKPAATVAAIVLLTASLVACGGGDDDKASADGSSSDSTSADGGGGGSDTTGGDSSDGGAGSGDSPGDTGSGSKTASITIGGKTYTSDLSASLAICVSMGGAIGAAGRVDGVDDSSLNIDLPPPGADTSSDGDWEPPSIRLDLGDDENGVPLDYRAGGEVIDSMAVDLEGKSQVDSYDIDGRTATGNATFVNMSDVMRYQTNQLDELESVQGTFEVDCG